MPPERLAGRVFLRFQRRASPRRPGWAAAASLDGVPTETLRSRDHDGTRSGNGHHPGRSLVQGLHQSSRYAQVNGRSEPAITGAFS